jgi:hypothetical protein
MHRIAPMRTETGTASRGLGDDQLDELLARARVAEEQGRIGKAQALLAIAISELVATGHWILHLFEWMGRLEAELGNYDGAAHWLENGRDLAVHEGRATSAFHMDLALARNAIAAGDLARADLMLIRIPHVVGPPPPIEASVEQLTSWLAALRLDGSLASIVHERSGAAFTVMELWRARGRYRSALALLAATRAAATDVTGTDPWLVQADLFEAELLFESGELDAAWQRVRVIPDTAHDNVAIRRTIVALRIAVRRGRLADARRLASQLAGSPTHHPTLIGQAAAARIAVFNELNLYEEAQAEVAAASVLIRDAARTSLVFGLLDRAAAATRFRAHTAVASWELPWVPEQAWWTPFELDEPYEDLDRIVRRRDRDAWIPLLDAILIALEAEDVPAARAHCDELVAITRGLESRYVTARVQVAEALVEYHDGGPTPATAERFVAAADALRASGARLAELQATRFAAWSAGRLGRDADHRVLAARAIAITDTIAAELEPADRVAFLMNKWSGRDDLVMLRLDHVLRTAPGHGRARDRRLCALFREVEQLTCWPVDDALGTERAQGLHPDDLADQVARWIAERRTTTPPQGFMLHSPWSLWRFPLNTVALHYHVLPDRIILFRIAWRRIEVFVLPISRRTLDRELARCLACIQDDNDAGSVDEVLAWLVRALGVKDALDMFPRVRRMIVVAHDVIANVPFAALPLDGHTVCERVAVSQLDRLSRLRRHAPRAVKHFVGFGLSTYQPPMAELPGADAEIAAVAAIVGQAHATQRLGAAATRGALGEALRSATHVHVAAHGSFDVEDPSGSGIELHDGRFTLRDLREMQPPDLRLVTLSTCWSAEAATFPGRERICLPTALLDVGARAVIASLWEVGDESGPHLMSNMYRDLRKLGPATALSRAQAAHAVRGAPRRDWAGFLCYGSE